MRCEGKIIGKIWLQLLGNREDILKTETSHNACIIIFFFFLEEHEFEDRSEFGTNSDILWIFDPGKVILPSQN